MVDLYRGLLRSDDALVVHAYETWGFTVSPRADRHAQHLGALHLRAAARGPRAHDRRGDEARPNTAASEAFKVHQALRERAGEVPREFVFMDRAAIGLGAVFLHLRAELNFYRLFNETIDDRRYRRGGAAAEARRFAAAGVPLPDDGLPESSKGSAPIARPAFALSRARAEFGRVGEQ